jgi:hypothetical protein
MSIRHLSEGANRMQESLRHFVAFWMIDYHDTYYD